MTREKIPAIGRIASLLLLVGAIVVIVAAFIRARKHAPPTGVEKGPPVLAGKENSVTEKYKNFKCEDGGGESLMMAAEENAYYDGRDGGGEGYMKGFGEEEGEKPVVGCDP